jgi:single-strand DNA-binding protein
MRSTAWRALAEHTAEPLRRGPHVIAVGRLRQRSFDGADGARCTVLELDVDEVGPSLRYAAATTTREADQV